MTVEDTHGALAPTEPEYEAIEAAVMETERGRRFLAEFARRNRHADTERLLAAIARLEDRVAAVPAPVQTVPDPEMTGLRRAICEMADEIASAKREIAAIKPQDGEQGEIADATVELDAIVVATERATSEILEAAEQVQEIAWTLREAGTDDAYCDALDVRATEIYTACSFQDITGQRTSKIVRVLQKLETRINTMAELWSVAPPVAAAKQPVAEPSPDAKLLIGPALEGQGASQEEVDRMIAEFRGEISPETDGLDVDSEGGGDVDPEEVETASPEPDPEQDEHSPVGAKGASREPEDRFEEPVIEAEDVEADGADPFAQLSAKDYESMFG